MVESDAELSERIHIDWWEKCRTCESWTGDRRNCDEGTCSNKASPFGQMITFSEGYCSNWFTYDTETAERLLKKWDSEV